MRTDKIVCGNVWATYVELVRFTQMVSSSTFSLPRLLRFPSSVSILRSLLVGGCVQVTTLLVCTHIQSLQRVFAHTHIHTHPPGRGRKKERGRDREKGRTRESKRNRERKRPAWHFEFPETEAAGLGRSRFGRSRKRTPLFSAKKRRNSSKDLPNHAQNHGKIVAKNIHLLITTFFLLAVRIKKRKMEAGRAACVSTSITYR